MKGILSLRKLAVMIAMCMAVACLPGYSEPTPEQIAERTRLLYEAIENNDVERAKLCIKLGADVNAHFERRAESIERDFSLVSYAASQGHKDITELLIEAGADVNAKNGKDNYDRTALMLVAWHGYKEIAELLIKAGADVNAKCDSGRTALMYGADAGKKDTTELLIKSGADVNAKDNDGYNTALRLAAWHGYKEIAELLVKGGADVNVKTNSGWTPLMFATSGYNWNKANNYKDVAELLIKAGADADATLIWAIKEKSNAVELLIELGANPNARDSEGISALDYAILYGKNDIADLLRAAGATE